MTTQPKVSIVVPIYGVEKYLKQCVDSILAQTLTDIEIILVDDGSPDKCPQIVDEYAKQDKRVVAVHQKNGGYGAAVNHGIALAHGKYIGIVESDDWIAPTMYEHLYETAEKTNVEICKASFYWVADSANDEKYVFEQYMELAKPGEIFTLKDKPALIKDHSSLWSAIYRKDFMDKHNIKLQESSEACYQDWPFVADVYSVATRITMLPETVYFYRNDVNNTNSSSQIKTKKLMRIIDQIYCSRDILIRNNCFDKNIQEAFYSQAFNVCRTFYEKIYFKYKPEFYKKIHKLFLEIKDAGMQMVYVAPNHKRLFERWCRYNFVEFTVIETIRNMVKNIFAITHDDEHTYKILRIFGIDIKIKKL